MNKRIWVAGVLLIVVLIPASMYAAQVDWVLGDATYSHLKGKWNKLEVGMRLFPGDIIKTGDNAQVTLIDKGSKIHIVENSTFSISEKYQNQEKKSAFMLFLGKISIKLGISSSDEPEISTQAVNLAIRGTELEVGSGYDGSTLVLLKEGTVEVQGREKQLMLHEGEGVEVGFGDEPTQKFKVMTRVIDWGQWFDLSQHAVKGNEHIFLSRILEKFRRLDQDIKKYENIRKQKLEEKASYIEKRDQYLEQGKKEQAQEYSRKAAESSKIAFHSIVNIRFLALSSIGLFDMAQRIYTGVEKPSRNVEALYGNIMSVYEDIEKKYIWEGDRERLERKARQKKGCLGLF